MTDPKQGQNAPDKGSRETGQQGTGPRDADRQGQRNPEPHKKGSETGKESRDI